MTTSNDKTFYNLHTNGIGYLNRIRVVKPEKADSFLACDIKALNGPSGKVSYVRFDARVSAAEAQQLVLRYADAVKADKKVMIKFRVGDLWGDIFTQTKGKNIGKLDVSFKVHLLFIFWIKVDGELVYKAESKPTDSDERESDVPASAETPAPQEAPAQASPAPAAEAPVEARELAAAESF